ncbi:MAG: hypothetical protein Q6K90_05755 [Gloeomargarita sp. HHBFW_bins_162]
MKLRILPLFLALTTLVPMTAQAQRTLDPSNLPKDIKLSTTISGTITAKDVTKLTKAYGQVKCNQLQVRLQESNSSDVVVQVPNQPQKSKFPDSYKPVTVQATGNHIGLGCKFSLTVPSNAVGKKGYLVVTTPNSLQMLQLSPQGWQNPITVPSQSATGRNFVADVIEIK